MNLKKLFLISILLIMPIFVEAKSTYLYDVIKEEAENNGNAKEYTKEHQDSIDASRSIKPIYYYNVESLNSALRLMESTNVVFAGFCWRMIRTTDTGGVKLLYNGPAWDNKCGRDGQSLPGFSKIETKTMATAVSYIYGTDYTYDVDSRKYTLTGDIDSYVWNEENFPNIQGKYTCLSNTQSGDCTNLYMINKYKSNTSALVFTVNVASAKSRAMTVPFNQEESFATIGYMYGDSYQNESTYTSFESFTTSNNSFKNKSISMNVWYAHSISWDAENGVWKLVDPFKITSSNQYSELLDTYTFNSSNESATGTSVRYIVNIWGYSYSYLTLYGGPTANDSIRIADSIVENGDGTYSLVNATTIKYAGLFSDNSQKYSCLNMNDTCSNMKYIYSFAANGARLSELDVRENILIAKDKNGSQLTDTLIVPKHKLLMEPDNYSDYKFTCNSLSDTCSADEIRTITGYQEAGYRYMLQYYFGSSVTWDGTKYTIHNTLDTTHFCDFDALSTHHFVCEQPNQTSCEKVRFLYHMSCYGDSMPGYCNYYYISLENGETTIEEALQEMLEKNENDSDAKKALDAWYEHYLIDYSDYLEETIFCNDRTIKDLGGWSENGNLKNNLLFRGSDKHTNLSCPKITDQFSVDNSLAKLKYSVGMLTTPEILLLGNYYTEATGSFTPVWDLTPNKQHEGFTPNINTNYSSVSSSTTYPIPYYVISNYSIASELRSYETSRNNDIRPVISLKPEAEYISGDGSMENPYVAAFIDRYKVDVVIKNETKDLVIDVEDFTRVEAGEEVKFNVTPIRGYKVKSIQILDAEENELSFTETDNKNEYVFTMPASNVTIIPTYEKTAASVSTEDNNHTKEIKIQVNDVTAVVWDDSVTFTIVPEEGYEVESIIITDEENNEIEYHKTNNANEYQFIMPDTDVIIKPTYRMIEKPSEDSPTNPLTKNNHLFVVIMLALIGLTFISYKVKRKD